MFGVYMSYWQSAAFVLACIAVFATLLASKARYWIALSAYALIVIGSAAMATFPMFFGISMANAFGPRNVSSMLTSFLCSRSPFRASSLGLFPFVSRATARRVAAVLFGGAVLIAIGFTLYSLFTRPRAYFGSGPAYGQLGLLFLLLWLRVYDIRSKLEVA